MVIVDTSVWIDFFGGIVNPGTTWLRRASGTAPLAVTDLIFCEVLQGIRHDNEFARIQSRLTNLEVFDSGGVSLALAAANNYRSLRARGYTTRTTIDLLIATFCIESGQELLHHDRDFDPFEKHLGLRVLHP
jgi:predicted nucleic acid-binding protein